MAMAEEPENQTGNGAGIVVGRSDDLPVERGKAAHRAKASRFSNCREYRRSTKCKSRIYSGNTWRYKAKGRLESRTS